MEKSNYHKWELKFKKRSIDIIPTKNLCVSVGKSTAFDCEMVKKPPDLTDVLVIVKMKSQRDSCLPQTMEVELVNAKIHMNV